MPRGFRSCAPFRRPLGRHRRRLRQITVLLIPAFQSLTFAAARENPWNRGSVAKVGLAAGRLPGHTPAPTEADFSPAEPPGEPQAALTGLGWVGLARLRASPTLTTPPPPRPPPPPPPLP